MKPTNEEEFWREQFSSGQSIISLPYNNLSQGSLNKEQSYTVHSFQSVLSPEISHKLISITKGSNMGLFIILLAGVQALLHKYTDEEDVILGIPALPEDDDELSPINDIIMIKNQFNRNQSFRLLLNEVKLSVQEAIENQNIPFWKMIQNLHIEHDVNGLPVINTLVSYKQLHPFDYSKEIRTDIIFEFDLVDNDIVLNVKYNDHHYYQSFISQMINHLNQLFSGVLQQPELELHKLDLLLENERNQLLHDFNSTTAEHQKEKAIHQLFEDQVSRSPDAIAVIFDDEKWTYRELNDRANQLAHTLRANGIQAEQLVGLMVERSFHMIVGMLAILKAGGAYVPIDPEYPEERVRYMLQDSGAQILLTQSELVHHISFEGKTILLENQDQYHDDRSNLEYQYNPNHLAYVIYTSGTTGNPKGVMVEHANLVDYVQTFVQEFQIVQDDHFLQQASISFDTSVEELYPPLVTGASLVITSKDDMLDSKILAEKIAQEKISIVSCSPLLLNELNKHLHDHSVRIFISGGDVLFKSHFLNLVPAKVYNTYGPTEGTVCATYYQCTYDEQQSIPIGKPIANKKVYILNASNQLQPIGVPGELCVAGTGVARGYLNRPELTAEKFVANPFEPSEVMYRTGDAARWLPDGNIEYIGRLDNQVKIRGYRIELGEVEAQLLNIDSVQEAVVTAHEDTSGEKNLCAYYVSSLTWSISELREKLVQALPAYMIPTYFVQLEQLPTTSNGKVDRKALPAPEAALQSSAEYVAPRTEEEEKLVQIWREVLGVEKIGVKDHFFDLGGHSLRAMNLVSKINKEMNVNLPLRAVFRSPTVEAMAEVIGGLEKNQHMSIPKVSDSDVYPVSSAQKRLYILHQLVGGEQSYNMPSELILEGPLDRERLENVFLELIHRHETLRTCFEMVEGEPVQRIQSDVHFEMPYIQAGEKEINEIVQDFVRPFDLEKAPLLRVGLVEEHKDRHILMLDMHHIISDGVSIEILIHELVQLYHGKELSPLRIQYKDYAVWQQSEVQSEQMKQQEAYWLKSFANELPVLELPTDYPRPAVQNFAGSLYEFVIDQDISKKIEKVANQSGATMYMVLLAAYKTLLYKYSGQEDLIVGTPIAGRQHADLEPLIGMFVNTLAIRSYPSGEKTFKEFLEEVKETTLEAYENQDYPFEELVENLNLGRDLSRNVLFDTLFALQNTEQEKLELEGLNIKPYPQEHKVAKFDLTFTIEEAEEGLLCEIEYATTLYNHVTIERMATHFKELLEAVVESPEETLASYHMIPDEEKKQLLYSFNDTRADYPTEKAVHQLFEEQVERTPDAVAVVQNGQSLTYGELNERANQLARTLRTAGVQADQLVGILAERSIEMIVGRMAVLKAGGAYVPIDPEYPEDRISYMLEDSRSNVLLVQQHLLDRTTFKGSTLLLEDQTSYAEDGSNLEPISHSENLAYVIYTSGTTGQPKGVMIEHKTLVNLCFWHQAEYEVTASDRSTLYAGVGFDASVWEIYPYLLCGATLYVVDAESRIDPIKLNHFFTENKISISFLPTQMSEQFMELENQSLRSLLIGGDKLKQFRKQSYTLYNNYGPTENTVVTTSFKVEQMEDNIPIGKPISNTKIYILNASDQLQPVGVVGELCIAGEGLARGYWNREELTAEKFVQNPFEPSERMYRTGDLARWLPNGNIEYIGRVDHQVKIRGFRIELGEVEAQLLKAKGMKEVIVTAREDVSGQKQLCAYFVAEQELHIAELREGLSRELPQYMIPAYFVQLEQMPLTPNGKIDRKSLPEPTGDLQTGTEYVAPRTEIEQALATVWQTVLGISQIGIKDHFFELGGDSIKSIQISSRLYQMGYKLEMKDLFKYPTIAKLSPHIQSIGRKIEQGEVTGEARLTPIQNWFFEQNYVDSHHFNQAVILYKEEGFNEPALHTLIQKIVTHHDVLRMVFRPTENGYEAWNKGTDEGELYTLDRVDLRDETDISTAIENYSNEIQASFDLSEGPLMKLRLFQCQDGDHLLIVIHHLVIDVVSWRILLEDFASGYEQAVNGQEIRLPQKTDSFLQWSKHLAEYANSPALEKEKSHWKKITELEVHPLPKDQVTEEGKILKDSQSILLEWSPEETEQLLKHVPKAYNTEINDILLTALGMALQKWSGLDKLKICLEGHGREEIIQDVDITRTIGWFTSMYPVVLDMEPERDLSYKIKKVKEDLRKIPNKGIGYGIWRYLASHTEEIEWGLEPEISFNYLGQFEQESRSSEISPYSSGTDISEKQNRPFVLNINGMIHDGTLGFDISYSKVEYRKETMEHFAQCLKESLQEIIEHCVAKQRPELTPSDVLLPGVTIDELDQLVEQTKHIGEIENVYRLTPMQKGMWFHSKMDQDSGVYFEQLTLQLHGHLDVELVRKSFTLLVQKHSILRTNIYVDSKEEPIQVVFKNRSIECNDEDFTSMESDKRKHSVQHFMDEDKQRGFNLAEDALMRLSILKLGDQEQQLIWSFHHILVDGWCLPILIQELLEFYSSFESGDQPQFDITSSYSDYIEWLETQDMEEAAEYWSRYLANYEQQTQLPQNKTQVEERGYLAQSSTFSLSEELTQKMNQIANKHQVTVNTLIQAAWGILLQKYNGTQDVVFGGVVSGRPAEIQGIEQMIGLFINTIPVRIYCEANESIVDVMKKIQEQALASQAYDYYPLFEIQAKTEQKHNLINHIVVFENYPVEEKIENMENVDRDQLRITDVVTKEQTNYDFNLIVMPDKEYHFSLDYNALAFDTETIEQIQKHFITILEQMILDPQKSVQELELLSNEDQKHLLRTLNNTKANYPTEKAVHQLFEEQVERTPDAVAVVQNGQSLTYRELNERANQLARSLRTAGVQADQLVGILAERSIEMIVGRMAVLKAGGAYVPIDPEYPEDRISYMLEDSRSNVLLVQQHLLDRTTFKGSTLLLEDQTSYAEDGSNLEPISHSENLAYVIYTSGTTGQPKGVMIEHKTLVNLCFWHQAEYEVTASDRSTLYAGVGFDASVWEIYPYLLCGATLYVVDAESRIDPIKLNHFFTENKISISFLPTQMSEQFMELENQSLRSLLIGGDKLKQFRKQSYTLYNNYGPTENTVVTTSFKVEQMEDNIPIGKPISNTKIYILNASDQLQPVGVVGELCIAGEGLARGYWNREELTAEKFVQNPFEPSERMYRTGDLARWLPNGNIEYIGRVDHQVKIRGFRIELGEVEAQLLKAKGMKEVIVTAREDVSGQKQLCAYFVAEQELHIAELRETLSRELPQYMIPAYFVQLEQMPLTPNGKIDRKALPEPKDSILSGVEYVAPRTETEEKLVLIWKAVLNLDTIGVKDNFFELGGHSLKATTLVSRIHKEMNIDLPLRTVFQSPTIEDMEEVISEMEHQQHVSIPLANKMDVYPVSSAQKRLYILQQLEGAEISNNIPATLIVHGALDVERFEHAFRQLIARHEILRTSFEMVDGEPVQRIHSEVSFSIEHTQAGKADEEQVIGSFVRAFDLEQAPLLRVGLHELEEERHILMLDMHHIISDGVSMEILIQEFAQFYEGKELPPLSIQYKDYAVWQQSEVQSQRMQKQEAYWLDTFAGEIPVLEMPTDYSRPAVQSFAGETIEFVIDSSISKSLREIASKTGTTLYMVFLAAYKSLLYKYSGQEDVVVGTPIAGRTNADLEPLIGMFVNTLAIRSYPSGEKTFMEFLEEVKKTTLQAYENQEYPLEELIEKLNIERSLSHNPLFSTMFVLQNMEQDEVELKGIDLQPYPHEHHVSKFDLTLNVVEEEEQFVCSIEYATALYKKETIVHMAEHFIQLVQSLVNHPQEKLMSLEMITADEKKLLLSEFNDTATAYPREKTIYQLFEEQVERTPEAIALVFEGQQLTYRELNERANQLAHNLREYEIQADQLVGIMVERSLEMVIGIFAVLKAGGAYLPIDPSYPEDRVRYLLEDSQCSYMLTTSKWKEKIVGEVTTIDLHSFDSSKYSTSNLESINTSEHLAYVIYTSGTTGNPKGVIVEHQSVVNSLLWRNTELGLNEKDRVLQLFSFSFDAFVASLFSPLLSGASVYLLGEQEAQDPIALAGTITKQGITLFLSVPSLYTALLDILDQKQAPNLRAIILGGEGISQSLIEKSHHFLPQVQLVNEYGPTENSVVTTFVRNISQGEKQIIGTPIWNNQVMIMRGHKELLPVNIPGELCVAGVGLARGYLNKPELTAEKFVEHPFNQDQRMYRTGDLAQWLPDGSIEYLGRIDHQVKIRGYRIELGEIEAQLLKIGVLRDVVVTDLEDETGQKYLCAYYTLNQEYSVSQLRSTLARDLPNYMIPSYFVQLEQMPLTPNGKIDRKALPEPDGAIQTGAEYVAPRTEVEEKLVEIWKTVLGLQMIGVKDHFFELGGHSLRATNLVSKIHKEMNVNLPLRVVFQSPTVEAMGEVITGMEQHTHISIPSAEIRDVYPVSSAQKRLYILHQLEGAELSYNMPSHMILKGSLDRERLEEAFRKLIVRHETLRTKFEMVGGEPVQKILSEVPFHVEYLQASEEEAEDLVDRFVRAFDLERAPLLRVGVIQLEVDRHILMLDKHHIISDGVSMELLTQEFMRLYAGEELPSLKIQYKDYAVWQHSQVQSERMKRQEAYWLKAFAGELPVLELPTDYVRPAVQSFAGDLFEFTIDSTISAGLKQIATETGSTLYMVLLAAYKCLLHKYSGQEDIIVGTPIAGRAHADLEPLVGMFVNTLALRSYPSAEKTFMEFLQEVKEMTLQSYENQEYPFEELVEHLNVERDLSRNALFNTMFTLQNTGQEEGELQGLRLQAYPQKHTISKFDLNINVVESEEGMLCSIEYATSLYMRETIELMAEHFTQLMKDVINDPQEKLLNLEMITAGEKTQILSVFNDTTADYPREKTIHQMFEEQVERTPDAIAIVFEDQEMSYRELNERANQLARTLRANGVCEDQLVGIMAERSLEMMIGIYAILKAGGAYVPIDPTHPEERIRYIMGDANADILLVQKHLLNKAAFDGLCIILEDEASYHEDRSNLGTMNLSSHLAYVIYTSGTTGNPKGVMVEHHSVINRILWMHEQYPISASDTILQKTAITFDVSVWELFWWSMVGSKVCLLSVGGEKNPKVILDTIAQHKVTTMHFVPAMLHAFLEYLEQQTGQELQEKLIYLRQVFASGEALTPSHANRFQQLVTPINQTRLINLYGPTEATVDVSFFDCPLDEKVESVPIGKPIDNIQLYIVNANNQLQPFGVAGELCIAGVGLARGYYNRPELTAEKFVQNPFVPGERMYRTGDLARWLSDGNIEYLGRIDHQVKIRGFRIELGEIEAKILNLASIQEAIVTDQADNTGQKYLCAYFTATHEWNVSELRAALAQELPSYMIPSYFVQLEQMPLSPNGKINRKALPKPEGSIQTGTEYMAPRSAVEEKLVQIWQDILGVKTVGIKDNFFDLGGHSLRATTLVTRMHKELNVDVPLRVIFESPTVEALAKVLPAMEHHAHISIPIAEEREFYPVSSAQKRLFILHQLEGAELSYNMPTIMKIEGALDRARLEKAFRQLMVRHETLRTGFEIVSGEPVQRIHSAVSFEIEYVEAREDETAEIFERFVRAFDLEKPPLLRVGVIEVGEEYQLLMLDMHHIISDGASTDLLVQDFVRFYEGEEVAPLRIQYKDYAVWQQSEEQSERLIKQEGYWLNAFSGELPVLEMPTDYARPSVRSFEGDTSKFVIDAELTEQIEKLTESHGATMYMTLLAAYNILLAKYSGQEDLVVGSPIAGRTHADLEPIIGVFVNTLAMRNQPLAERAFHEFLMDVKQNALLAYENQEYPFEELVTKLNLQRDVSRNPLFDTMFLLNTTDEQEVQAEASLSVVPSYNQTFAKFDLLLGMSIENGEINGEFEYCTKLFKKNTVEKMSQDLLFILTQIAQDPQIKLKDIKLSGTENNSEDLVESVEFMF